MIEERTGLLDLAMTVAYTSRTNFKDAFGSVGMWDSMIYNDLKKRICQTLASSKDFTINPPQLKQKPPNNNKI